MKIRVPHATGRLRLAAAACLVVAATLTLSACGSSTPSGNASSASDKSSPGGGLPAADSALHAMLPDSIKNSGVVTVAATFGYPPHQFYGPDNKTPVGVSVDLANALGAVLGVKFQFTNMAFESILPSLASGRSDMSINSMSATEKRAKQALFVEYLNAGTTIIAKAGNPEHITTEADLCGKVSADLKGSIYGERLKAFSDQNCVAKGKKPINVQVFADVNATFQAIITGRADASVKDFSVNAYTAKKSDGQLQVVSGLTPDVPYGIAIGKTNTQLAKATQAAMNEIIKDGAYAKILKDWGLEAGAITDAKIIGAES
jgi:polar amino acid transport system substrate-binding protein